MPMIWLLVFIIVLLLVAGNRKSRSGGTGQGDRPTTPRPEPGSPENEEKKG